jgi:hypothetical protein
MDQVLIAKGHGYESGKYGRCTAFDGFEIIANPLGGYDAAARDSRVFGRKENGKGGCNYSAYSIKLGKREFCRDLYILMQHGGGREVWKIPAFYDNGELETHILAMPERLQFAILKTLYGMANAAKAQGETETRQKWAQAFADGRIRKKRATKSQGARVEIIPQWEVDLKKEKASRPDLAPT